MLLTTAVDEFLLAHDYTPATTRTYQERLGAFIHWAQASGITTVADITTAHVRRYLDERRTLPSRRGTLRDTHTLHSHARSLLAWLHWLEAEEVLAASVTKRVAVPRREQKIRRTMDKRQIERLIAAAADNVRDAAIVAVLLDTGMRARELCLLQRSDVSISPDSGYITVKHGKGRRQREVPLGRRTRLALGRLLRSHSSDTVFLSQTRQTLTVSGLDQALLRLFTRAGRQHYQGLHLGAHTFRHTMAANFIQAGGSIYHLSRLMGHSQVTTTEGYLTSLTARQIREKSLSPLDSLGT